MTKKNKKLLGFDRNLVAGIIIIAIGIFIYLARPAADCAWYDFGCKATGLVTGPIFFGVMITLVIIGVRLIAKTK